MCFLCSFDLSGESEVVLLREGEGGGDWVLLVLLFILLVLLLIVLVLPLREEEEEERTGDASRLVITMLSELLVCAFPISSMRDEKVLINAKR